MDSNLIKIIKDVLDKWENYGYLYFIGHGTCPKNPTNGDSSKRKRAITKK